VKIRSRDLRKHTHDRHRTADDKPFGGGPGMIMKPEPIFECVEYLKKQCSAKKSWVVLMDPRGETFTQKIAVKLARKKHIILIAGHYEGIDERVREGLADQEVSVGDFITTGGETPALCVLESVVRLVPGVLGNEDSLKTETFQESGLEYPQYTRPREFRGMKVPEVLLSGHHREVAGWRKKMARKLTLERRPDLS